MCIYIFPPSRVLLPKAFVLRSVLIIRQTFYKSSPKNIPPHSPGLDPLFPRLCSFLLYFSRAHFPVNSWEGNFWSPQASEKVFYSILTQLINCPGSDLGGNTCPQNLESIASLPRSFHCCYCKADTILIPDLFIWDLFDLLFSFWKLLQLYFYQCC